MYNYTIINYDVLHSEQESVWCEGIPRWICSKQDFGEGPSEERRIRLRPDSEEVTMRGERGGFPAEGQEGPKTRRWTKARCTGGPPGVWWAAAMRHRWKGSTSCPDYGPVGWLVLGVLWGAELSSDHRCWRFSLNSFPTHLGGGWVVCCLGSLSGSGAQDLENSFWPAMAALCG